MKLSTFRLFAAVSLTALLAACGGAPEDMPTQTAASVQTGVATTSVTITTAASNSNSNDATGAAASNALATPAAAGTAVNTTQASTDPAPDCAADGCSSLRIIDGNAEAFRYHAMRRAATEAQS